MAFSLTFIKDYLSSFSSFAPSNQDIFTVAAYMILIFLYAIFIWRVYHAISRKDVISLNLSQYNSLEHPVLNKILAVLLYFIEYIIVLPFLILFWYILFALVLLVFSENLSLEKILLLSAAVVGAIRLLAYYKSHIASEIAKLLPFTILAITLLSPRLLDVGKFTSALEQIPDLLLSAGYALLFIIGLEIILRFLDLIKRLIVGDK